MQKKLTVTTDAFNTRCAELLELVRSQNTVIEIKHAGTLVAKLVPADHKNLFGALKGSVTYHDDIVRPIEAEWETNS